MSGQFLACSWLVSGLFLACSWLAPGFFLASFWLASGLLLACSWLVSGLVLACFWPGSGFALALAFLEWAWSVFGLLLACFPSVSGFVCGSGFFLLDSGLVLVRLWPGSAGLVLARSGLALILASLAWFALVLTCFPSVSGLVSGASPTSGLVLAWR